MFIGEFGCVIPLLLQAYPPSVKLPNSTYWERVFVKLPFKSRSNEYQRVAADEGEQSKADIGETLAGWRMCLMWFPAFFDSQCERSASSSRQSAERLS